jgi:hypothetical protein
MARVAHVACAEGSSSENSDDDEDIPDIDEFVDDNLEDDDVCIVSVVRPLSAKLSSQRCSMERG